MRSIRLWFNKKDTAKYISHLDITRCMTRAFRRTDIPLWYTEGFNPHPYLVFSLPLPLGVEADFEALDIRLNDDNYPSEKVLEELNKVMVPGMTFLKVSDPVYKPIEISKAEYSAEIPFDGDTKLLSNKIKSIISEGNLTYEKKTKKKEIKLINACEHLSGFRCVYHNNKVVLHFILPAGNDFTVSPVSFCESLLGKLCENDILCRITRHKLLIKDGTDFI